VGHTRALPDPSLSPHQGLKRCQYVTSSMSGGRLIMPSSRLALGASSGSDQPLPDGTRGLLKLGAPLDPVRRRDRRKLFGVPPRVAGAADQAGGVGIERFEPTEDAG
jgi:hypothetical protein